MRRQGALFAILAGLLLAPPAIAADREVPHIQYPAYQGPKKTIAVTKFDAVGAFVGKYGGWDIGGGLAAMLVEELNRTNRFVVVDRADLDALLREKQMALGDVSKGASGAPLLAAQTFVRGSVTEFDQDEKCGGFSIGLGLNGNGGGASRRVANGHVAIDLRMIDSETGVVLATAHVDRKVRSSSIALSGMARNVSFGGDQFRNTSLGKASRAAIEEAVAQIISGMERVPFGALVARVDGPHI